MANNVLNSRDNTLSQLPRFLLCASLSLAIVLLRFAPERSSVDPANVLIRFRCSDEEHGENSEGARRVLGETRRGVRHADEAQSESVRGST